MEVLALAERTLTQLGHARLTNLVFRHKRIRSDPSSLSPIAHLLEEATIVPWRLMPPGMVTMRSPILLACQASGERKRVTLCYPPDADSHAGQVSVLSPLGSSLLGQHVGATVDWTTSNGDNESAEILEVSFQPESSGVVAK